VQNNSADQGLSWEMIEVKSILKRAFSGQLVPQDPNDEPASQLLTRIQAERTEQETATQATKKAKKKTARKRKT
jgi:type I restriction enzyme S subunit